MSIVEVELDTRNKKKWREKLERKEKEAKRRELNQLENEKLKIIEEKIQTGKK